jgi:hypothetical protein
MKFPKEIPIPFRIILFQGPIGRPSNKTQIYCN